MSERQGGTFRAAALRWVKFNAIGAGGMAVQLGALALLRSGLGAGLMTATAMAVEAAVIHNYFWHERFTWADRETGNSLARFAKFNLTTGLFSVAGNLVFMRLFVSGLRMNYLVANMVTIATCSVVNFVVSDRVVFDGRSAGLEHLAADEEPETQRSRRLAKSAKEWTRHPGSASCFFRN